LFEGRISEGPDYFRGALRNIMVNIQKENYGTVELDPRIWGIAFAYALACREGLCGCLCGDCGSAMLAANMINRRSLTE
jgi:hypothetical protein